jgi:LysM repeat protein
MLIAVTGAAVIVVLLIGNALGILGGAPASTPSPTPSPTVTAVATERIAPTPTPLPTSMPTEIPTPTPSAAPTPTPAPTPRTYVVQLDDNLSKIAERFGTTAQAIADANGITLSTVLNVGQVLIIP